MSGFISWVFGESGLEGDVLEAALVMQKGFFMSTARQYELPAGPVTDAQRPFIEGTCFGYASERIGKAVRNGGMFRDFSETPEDLLRYR